MSRLFAVAVVPWMLCAVMSQAYPMAVSTSTEGQTQSAPAPETLPSQPHDPSTLNPSHTEGQTISASAPVNVHVTLQSQQGQCPPNTKAVPCPHQCQCLANSENKPTGENTETEQKKKSGVWNALKKVAYLCANTVYESLVGENGILTNLPDKIACGPPPKKPKKKQNKTSGNVRACCIFNSGGPPVIGDESDEEEEAKNTKTIQLPPMNFVYVKNEGTVPGVPAPAPAPAQAPIVKGAKHKTSNIHFNGCCIGKRLFNVKKLFKWICKPQINICAGSANVNVIEIN